MRGKVNIFSSVPAGQTPMDENPYEAPRVAGDAKLIRVRIRWWPSVGLIIFAALFAALILPALQPGRGSNCGPYFEWRRQQRREAEQRMNGDVEEVVD